MIVAFCGHREIADEQMVREWLQTVIAQLIAEGASEFWFGGKGKFDAVAADETGKFKAQYPHIRRTLVQAYINQEKNPLLHEDSMYPPLESVPKRFAMPRRNRWMAENADAMVTYAVHNFGNAMAIMQYAQRLGKRVINYPA